MVLNLWSDFQSISVQGTALTNPTTFSSLARSFNSFSFPTWFVLFCQKLFFLPAALASEIYSVSSTQNKKNIATKSTFIVYSTFSVCAAFVSFSLMFSNLRVVIPLAFRDKTLFLFCFSTTHPLGSIKRFVLSSKKTPHYSRHTVRCINSFIRSREGNARKRR